jgi:ankyrin repeat protein
MAKRLIAVKMLLNTKKVDIYAEDKEHCSPFSLAMDTSSEIIELLLGAGEIDGDATDSDGRTILHWAVERSYSVVVDKLLKMELVNVNAVDRRRRTALSLAAGNGSDRVVELLLNTGKVDPDIKDDENQNPLLWTLKAVRRLILMSLPKNTDTDLKEHFIRDV